MTSQLHSISEYALIRSHVQSLSAQQQLRSRAQLDAVFGGREPGAAAGTSKWVQLQLGNSGDDAGMNGLRRSARIQIEIHLGEPHAPDRRRDTASPPA